VTLPDSEIDPITGKLRQALPQQGFIQSSLNRNLLYVKSEIDAKFASIQKITVSNTTPSNPSINDLWVDTT